VIEYDELERLRKQDGTVGMGNRKPVPGDIMTPMRGDGLRTVRGESIGFVRRGDVVFILEPEVINISGPGGEYMGGNIRVMHNGQAGYTYFYSLVFVNEPG
jgi:hypothetical protein